MDATPTASILHHEHDDLAPECGPSFADVVYLLTTPPPGTPLNKTWDLGTRLSSYVALFAYSLVHPQQCAFWVNDTWSISKTIKNAAHGRVRQAWSAAAKSKVVYLVSVAALSLFSPRGPDARARDVARPVPVHAPPEDG